MLVYLLYFCVSVYMYMFLYKTRFLYYFLSFIPGLVVSF